MKKNNEEQAGAASEVWRLRQFLDRSNERTGLRLLQTHIIICPSQSKIELVLKVALTGRLCSSIYCPCQLDLLLLKGYSIDVFYYQRDIHSKMMSSTKLQH